MNGKVNQQDARTNIASLTETLTWLAVLLALIGFSSFPLPALASDQLTFQPDGCEFRTSISRDAEIKQRWRGESPLTTAVQKSKGAVIRASCGSYFVQDWHAFRQQLPGQLERAARIAGIDRPQTAIRRTAMGTVASYWGFRGTGAARTFFRSDSYVGNRSFMEIVVMAHPAHLNTGALRQTRASVHR